MRKIIKNKCIDIIDIENNNIYINCTFFDDTIKEKLNLYNNVIINCVFRKIYKEIFCTNTYFNKIEFEKSWTKINGSFYFANIKLWQSFIDKKSLGSCN